MRSLVVAASCLALALTACSDDDPRESGATPSDSGIPTITVSALPEAPPTGKLIADMRQSSRDAAAGRMEVWLDNDTLEDVTPTKITYTDARFRTPLTGERLRTIPARSTRGFQLYLPPRPTCGHSNDVPATLENPLGTVTVEYAGHSETIEVADETDVAGRYTQARCLEIAIAKVATISWSDDVTPGDPKDTPVGADGTLTLVLDPTGKPGPALTIDSIAGTPILSASGSDVWRPDVTISGTDDPLEVPLPLKPTRCDAHAFAESGGATAFKINLTLGGKPGSITLRMTPAGAANAINYARASCGLLVSVDGDTEG